MKKKTFKEEKIPFNLMTREQKREHARGLWRRLKWHLRASKMVFIAQRQVEDNFLLQFKQDMNFEQDAIQNQIKDASSTERTSFGLLGVLCCRLPVEDSY